MSELESQVETKECKASGLKLTLHGVAYQLKLLMLFFQRGLKEEDFKLYTEVETAEKFDDLIFQYKNGYKNCRFLQAKHSQNQNREITATDLLTERGQFSLKKYFQSYRRIKINQDFEGMKKDFVICTNRNIDKKLENCFEEVNDKSKMLKHNKKSSRLYKFKIQSFPRRDDLVKHLKSCSDLRKFSTELARWATTEIKPILKQDHIFHFHGSILREIIEINRSKRIETHKGKHKGTVSVKFRQGFLKGDKKELLIIRKAFCEAAIKMSKNTLDEEQVWVKMGEKVLEISQVFAKKLETSTTSKKRNFALPDDNISNEDIKDFFDNLIFAVGQPNEEELDEIIETEINEGKEMLNMISTPFIASEFQRYVLNWMKKKTNTCLTRKDGEDFFENAKSELSKLSLTGQSLEFKAIIKNFDISFNEELQDLSNFLLPSSEKQIFNLINPHKPALSSIKVVSILDSAQQYKKAGYILISLKSLLLIKDHVINAFTTSPLLVIECEGNEGNIDDLFIKLSMKLEKSTGKKIILITEKDNHLANKFKEKFNSDKYEEKDDNSNKLTDLTIKSQKKLLSKGKVLFQGREVSLKALTDDEAKKLIDGEILFQLVKGEKMEVGIKRLGLHDFESIHYVTSVNISMEQLSNALKNNNNDLFVFSGIKEDELSQIIPTEDFRVGERICLFGEDVLNSKIKYVILTEDEDEEKCIDDFKQVCSDYSLLKTENQQFSAYLYRKKRDNRLTWICSYNPSLYVNRKLYQVVIEKDSLREIINKYYAADERKDIKRDIFAISNIKEDKFEENYGIKVSKEFPIDEESVKVNHIYILNGENEEDTFRSFCNRRDLKKYYNIHWLQNKEQNGINYLLWRLSEGELDVITKLKQVEVDEMCIDEKVLRSKRAVIIAGDSGIGKSTTLARLLWQPNVSEWIIKLDLINLEKQLNNSSHLNDLNSFFNSFFFKINIGLEGALAKLLFKYKVECQGKITFLFDGFDEITAKSQETVIKLLKLLKETKGNFWITTRLHYQDKIEKSLLVPSYSFKPFTPYEQKKFLMKFWQIGHKFAHELNKNIFSRATLLFKKITKTDLEVMSIPLMTRMFAEVYQEVIDKSYNCDNPEELEDMKNLVMSDLYERFIRRNYDIYFKEKIKFNNMPDYLKNDLISAFNKNHQHLAFRKLFPQYAEVLTDKYEQLSADDKKYFTSIGIVKADSSKTDLYFTHQTFAEYFTARFLVRTIKKRKDHPKYKEIYKFYFTEIFKHRNKLIEEFIDEATKKENLEGKWNEIKDCDLVKTRAKKLLNLSNNQCPTFSAEKLKEECTKELPVIIGTDENIEEILEKFEKGPEDSIVSDIKWQIDKFFEDSDMLWLEEKGSLVSRCLKILTDKMSKKFLSFLSSDNAEVTSYSKRVFNNLMPHFADLLSEEELPQVDKVAFLRMLEGFLYFNERKNCLITLTHKQLQSILQFFEKVVNFTDQNEEILLMIVSYLITLGKMGFKLFNVEKTLLVSDPASEFHYEFVNKAETLIEKMKKCKNLATYRKSFTASRAPRIKRKATDINLTKAKKLKIN